MLYRLDLSSILVPVHEEFICLRSEDIGMDETICIVCTSCAVGRVVWTVATSEVRGQDLVGLALVALVDHSKGGDDHESIPVGGRFSPAEIITQEGVIGRIGVHHCVHPDGGRVENRLLVANVILDLINQKHISMIVFLQELKIKALINAALQNSENLFKLGLILLQECLGCDLSHHCLSESLTFLLNDIKSDLVSDQILISLV